MPHDVSLIATIVAGVGLAMVLGLIAARLRLPPLVGYLVAGVLVSPATPGYVADVGLAGQLAKIGVMLLMFGVGLHASIDDLMDVKKIAETGDQIGAMDDAALRREVEATDVFARAAPEHKLRRVAALQAEGQLVAMTGDSVNDAPALKAADIGVATGGMETDAAREASGLVLTDDNFATIARAVREGRLALDNLKKSLMHMLPARGGEAGVILLAIFARLLPPITAGQILWVNTVTSVTPAPPPAFEPAERGVMRRTPCPSSESVITRAAGSRILFAIALLVAASFLVFHRELDRGRTLGAARTAAVNTIVVGAAVCLLNSRRHTEHAFRRETFRGTAVVLRVLGILAVLQLVFTYAVPMQHPFRSVALDAASRAVILGMGVALFLAVELERAWLRRVLEFRL